MVAFFIVAISTIALFGYIATNALAATSVTADSVGRIETTRRLDAAAASLTAMMSSSGTSDLPLMPAGVQTGLGYTPPPLPVSIVSQFGRPFMYCPFGPVSGGSGSITGASGASYSADVVSGYVVAGRPGFARLAVDPNLMGYLIALRGRTGTLPSCEQVSYNATTGLLEAPGGMVRPISRIMNADQLRATAMREIQYYIAPNGDSTVSGYSQAAPTTLAVAMAAIRANKPNAATVNFVAGTYVNNDSNMFSLADAYGAGRGSGRVTLAAASGPSTVTIQNPANTVLWSYGDMYVRDLAFDSHSYAKVTAGHVFAMSHASIGAVLGTSGTITIADSTLLGSSDGNRTATLSGTRVESSGVVTLLVPNASQGAYLSNGARWSSGGSLSFGSSDGGTPSWFVYLETGTLFAQEQGSIAYLTNSSSAGINVMGGRLDLLYTTVYANVQIGMFVLMDQAGTLDLVGSKVGTVGVKPYFAVRHYNTAGAANVTVTGSYGQLSALLGYGCWAGPEWTYSSSSNSAVSADEAMPTLSPSPTSAEVQAYVAASSRNAGRASARLTNSSSWSCSLV